MTTTETNGMATSSAETGAPSAVEEKVEAVQDEVRGLAAEAKRTGTDVSRDARDLLRSRAEEQAGRVAGSLHGLAAQLEQMGKAADGGAADLANDAAGRFEDLATRLDREGFESVLAGTRRFARERTGTFLLLAVAGGVVSARLWKAADTGRLVEAAKGNGESPTGDAASSPTSASAIGTPTSTPPALASAPTLSPTGAPTSAPGEPTGSTPQPAPEQFGSDR